MHLFPTQDKVMLGTDYPFPLGELQPGALIESMDDFDEKLKVTKNNTLTFVKTRILSCSRGNSQK